jgi:hypothetical protein
MAGESQVSYMATHDPDTSNPPRVARHDGEWFYTHRGETYGPVSSAELQAAAHLGFVGPDDMVLRKGFSHWMYAKSVPGLFQS